MAKDTFPQSNRCVGVVICPEQRAPGENVKAMVSVFLSFFTFSSSFQVSTSGYVIRRLYIYICIYSCKWSPYDVTGRDLLTRLTSIVEIFSVNCKTWHSWMLFGWMIPNFTSILHNYLSMQTSEFQLGRGLTNMFAAFVIIATLWPLW